jgi:hypothetical protein
MNAPLLFVVAMLVPLLLAAVLLLPPYLGMLSAVYIVYMPAQGAHPLAGHFYDVFFVVNAYDQLLGYWSHNVMKLGFFEYALPIALLPAACTVFSIWVTAKLSRKLLNLFYDLAASGE